MDRRRIAHFSAPDLQNELKQMPAASALANSLREDLGNQRGRSAGELIGEPDGGRADWE
jgi:hypothetical protein